MSKFDQAAAKAAGSKAKAAPKANTSAVASAPTPAPAVKPATVSLGSLEEKKKFVVKHEIKIEDLQDKIKDEPKKDKKKPMEAELKALQKDETYLKAIEDIKEAEAQAVRDAERAALTAKADKKSFQIKHQDC
jgi:hypothetical protein